MFGEALRADPFEEVTVGKDDDAVEDGRARTMMGAAGGDSGSPVCCATPLGDAHVMQNSRQLVIRRRPIEKFAIQYT